MIEVGQGVDGLGHDEVGLAGAGGADAEGDGRFLDGVGVGLLAKRLGADGAAMGGENVVGEDSANRLLRGGAVSSSLSILDRSAPETPRARCPGPRALCSHIMTPSSSSGPAGPLDILPVRYIRSRLSVSSRLVLLQSAQGPESRAAPAPVMSFEDSYD